MPSLKKCPNHFEKYVEHCFRKGMKPFPALAPLLLGEIMRLVCLAYIFIH